MGASTFAYSWWRTAVASSDLVLCQRSASGMASEATLASVAMVICQNVVVP